jgi:Type I restriction enzyme R protein N terminus (HSDR_N)
MSTLIDKKSLSERDICTKFITPAVKRAVWDEITQIREEVSFTKGRIIVRGKLVTRGRAKRADYILYYQPNIPLALIEAKDNNCCVGDGIQQGLEYAATLNIPFVFSSNGDGFVFHDRTGSSEKETSLTLDQFPSPAATDPKSAIFTLFAFPTNRLSNSSLHGVSAESVYVQRTMMSLKRIWCASPASSGVLTCPAEKPPSFIQLGGQEAAASAHRMGRRAHYHARRIKRKKP